MKLRLVYAKPLKPLPKNAVKAHRVARIESYQRPLDSSDVGVFLERGKPTATLMTFGAMYERYQVEENPRRDFVFVGTALSLDPVTDEFVRKELFEEIL